MNKQEDKAGDKMDETTKEDILRMTLGLTDQKTIAQLSLAGTMAQQKREDMHHSQAKKKARLEEEMKKKAGGKHGDKNKSTDETDKHKHTEGSEDDDANAAQDTGDGDHGAQAKQ